MNNKNLILFSAAILLIINTRLFSQTGSDPNRSKDKTAIWTFTLPDDATYGPMDITARFEYHFFRETFGDKSYLGFEIKTTEITYAAKFYGSFRFKYHGIEYRHINLQAVDSRGMDGYSDLKVTGFHYTIYVNGNDNRQSCNSYNYASNTKVCEISNTADINSFDLNFVHSAVTDIRCDNVQILIDRINNFEKAIIDRDKYKSAIQKADQAFQSKNWSEAKQYYSQAASVFPNEKYPTIQLEKIKGEEEKLATSNTPAHSKNNTNTSQNPNSNQNNTTEDGTNTNQNNTSNYQSTSSNSSQNRNNQSGEITNMSEYVGMEGSKESIKVYQQNGRYYIKSQNGSTTETDKQYFDKIQTVSAGNAQIAATNEQRRKQNDPLGNYKEPTTNSYNNNPMTNSNSTNNSYTQAANAIGSALTQWGDQMAADRLANEQRQQEREEEDERRQAAAAVVKANKQKLVNNRKSLIAKFPDSKTPLSYEVKDVTEIYYFVYSYQAAAIGGDAPVIYISNEFSLAKYADGTWPFKASLIEKIAKTNKGLDFILSGYYLTQIEAAEQKQLLMNSANEYGFIVNKISYTSKKSLETSSGSIDYWGNPIKKTEQQPAANSPAKQEPVKSKPNLDYWGNPIKE